jgi:SP family myo-inositol transporter-like MFS transporter 13
MVGLGAAPAAIQFAMLWFLPETPRWLVKVGRREQARRVLGRVYGSANDEGMGRLVDRVLRKVEMEIAEEEDAAGQRAVPEEGKTGLKARFSRVSDNFSQLIDVGGNRRALIIACMLQGFQQLCGFVSSCHPFVLCVPSTPTSNVYKTLMLDTFTHASIMTNSQQNSLMYFSATIFSLLSFDSPTLTSLSIALTNFAFTLVAFYYIDRIGRRRILLYSIPIMIIGLVLCAVAFRFLELPARSHSLDPRQVSGGGGVIGRQGNNRIWPLIILSSMLLYVAGYALGLGNVPWQQSELFPLSVRSLGSSISTATNWGSNFLIGVSFLPMMEWAGPTGTFVLYAGVCGVAWGTVWRIYPETAGLGLEDVGGLLRGGWGVEESLVRWGRRKGRVGSGE